MDRDERRAFLFGGLMTFIFLIIYVIAIYLDGNFTKTTIPYALLVYIIAMIIMRVLIELVIREAN